MKENYMFMAAFRDKEGSREICVTISDELMSKLPEAERIHFAGDACVEVLNREKFHETDDSYKADYYATGVIPSHVTKFEITGIGEDGTPIF